MWPRVKKAFVAGSLESTPRASRTDWRRRQLRRAGFAADLSASIATERAIDLHALIELVERGCPRPLAARILAPLDRESTTC
jgi:hypothetical protein